jgi:hypothetical protein
LRSAALKQADIRAIDAAMERHALLVFRNQPLGADRKSPLPMRHVR